MKTLRSRFIFTHILPTLLVVPLAGLVILYLVETQVLLADLAADVQGRATLLAGLLADDAEVWQDSDEARFFVARVSTAVTGNIILLNSDGDVLATNDPAQTGTISLPQQQVETQVTYTLLQQTAVAIVPVFDLENQLAGYVHVSSTLADASALFTELRQLVIVSVILELTIATLIGAYLATRLAKPITATTTAVSDIAYGQRIEPIPEQGAKEIKTLAHSVNSLAERLRDLEETRRKLLANLVHELGRPLGAMLAAAHALRTGADEEPELRQELLKGIESHIEQMQPLLDDLAQLHGQVLGTRELNRQPTALSDWLPPLLLPWRASAQEKGLTWATAISPDLPTLPIDTDRMAQAIGNLVSNAIKYTPAGGQVSVTAVTQDNTVQITVSDTGPGIPPLEQEKIFEPFYRSRQQTRFPQGMGLGLTIARDLVEVHGGELKLESNIGNGSQFAIWLAVSSGK